MRICVAGFIAGFVAITAYSFGVALSLVTVALVVLAHCIGRDLLVSAFADADESWRIRFGARPGSGPAGLCRFSIWGTCSGMRFPHCVLA